MSADGIGIILLLGTFVLLVVLRVPVTFCLAGATLVTDRKSTRLNSSHT